MAFCLRATGALTSDSRTLQYRRNRLGKTAGAGSDWVGGVEHRNMV
jgi:hypothetical protein